MASFWFHFGFFLASFWLHFGLTLVHSGFIRPNLNPEWSQNKAKMKPKWSQNEAKKKPKANLLKTENTAICQGRLRTIFGIFLRFDCCVHIRAFGDFPLAQWLKAVQRGRSTLFSDLFGLSKVDFTVRRTPQWRTTHFPENPEFRPKYTKFCSNSQKIGIFTKIFRNLALLFQVRWFHVSG